MGLFLWVYWVYGTMCHLNVFGIGRWGVMWGGVCCVARAGSLVRVVGNPRDYDGKRHVLVYDYTELTDWNEITHHMLDVIYTHLLATNQIQHPVGAPTSAVGIANSGQVSKHTVFCFLSLYCL